MYATRCILVSMNHSERNLSQRYKRDAISDWPKIRDDTSQIKSIEFKAQHEVSVGNLISFMQRILLDVNANPDLNSGVHYAGEFYFNPRYLDGLSRAAYWDTTQREPMTKRPEYSVKPGDALTAFFEGPTFADCGSVIYASLLRSLEQTLGTSKFNELFGRPLQKFVITPSLYDSIEVDEKLANPLLFLFEKSVGNFKDEDVQTGDIVHIEGVSGYQQLHPDGYAGGWNVVCVGQDDSGKNLYLGFGSEEFPSPRTYDQVAMTLINAYYKDQNDKDEEKNSTPIGGITVILRLEQKKLEKFASLDLEDGWWVSKSNSIQDIESAQKTQKINYLTDIAPETRSNSFDNYEKTSDTQAALFELCRQFAESVMGDDTEGKGLVLTGVAGIGKTHLAHAIGQEVSKNVEVAYLDAHFVSNLINDLSKELGHTASEYEFREKIRDLIKDSKLIILDDFNGSPIENYALSEILRLHNDESVSFVVTSNKEVPLSRNSPQQPIEDPSNQVLVVDNLRLESWRTRWWEKDQSFVDIKGSFQIIDFFIENTYSVRPMGAVIDSAGLSYINEKIESKQLFGKYQIPYKASELPERDFYIFDMRVVSSYDLGNFLGIFPDLIKANKKFFIVTDDKNKLEEGFQWRFDDHLFSNNKMRLVSRLNSIIHGFDYPQ